MDELAKRFAELAEKFSPAALEAARGAVRVEAMSQFASMVITIALALAFYFAASYLWGYQTRDSFDAGFLKVFGGACFIGCGICILITLWTIIDPWTWTALYNPDLYMAKKILKL